MQRTFPFSPIRIAAIAFAIASAHPLALEAQARDTVTAGQATWANRRTYSGPRFGATLLSSAMVDSLEKRGVTVGQVVSQFGWQFEREFYSVEGGLTALNEWAILVGGLERGAVLPSLSWIVGIRGQRGVEFGIGPNLTPLGLSLAAAGGVRIRAGGLNFPVNLAVVSTKVGVRTSLLAGFTLK